MGVTTVAIGISSVRIASTASSRSSRNPVLATITGSITAGLQRVALQAFGNAPDDLSCSTACLSSPHRPRCLRRWRLSAPRSSRLASPVPSSTPMVFWAVIVVMAQVPNTPIAPKVLRSAWMPAPPPESDPAMVMARGTRLVVMAFCPVRLSSGLPRGNFASA